MYNSNSRMNELLLIAYYESNENYQKMQKSELESEIFELVSSFNASVEEQMECLIEKVSKYENKMYLSFGDEQNCSKIFYRLMKFYKRILSVVLFFMKCLQKKKLLLHLHPENEITLQEVDVKLKFEKTNLDLYK